MSQFCGSFAALSNRSLLTVILYCAAVCDAAHTVIDTPAIAAQAMVTSLRLRYCMTAPPMKPAVHCGRLRVNESKRWLLRRLEIFQVRRRLVLGRGHERAVCALEIGLIADLENAFAVATVLGPIRVFVRQA